MEKYILIFFLKKKKWCAKILMNGLNIEENVN